MVPERIEPSGSNLERRAGGSSLASAAVLAPARSPTAKRSKLSLARRLAWATATRLFLVSAIFAAIVLVNVRKPSLLSFTVVTGLWAVAVAFAMSATYAWLLKRQWHLKQLALIQLVIDQLLWTVLVYLSGGVTSGATSFYGVTCFFGAILAGFRGAAVAAVAGACAYGLLSAGLLLAWVAPPPDQPASVYAVSLDEALYSGGLNVLVLIVVALLAGNLAERLRAAGGQVLRAEARANQAEREAGLGRVAAGLAHEIRNPLGSIAGSARLLSSNPEIGGEDRQLCEIIVRESQRLEELVSDMLDLAKPRKPMLAIVDLTATGREVARLSSVSGRGVDDVSVSVRGDDDVHVTADGAMLRQLLWNLVRNAVQASHPGGVVALIVSSVQGRAQVAVVDHGSGLDASAKEQIFDPFYTTRSKGTGIGLAVVKRIADEHDWQIWVDDTPGGGATFWIELGAIPNGALGATATADVWTLFPKLST